MAIDDHLTSTEEISGKISCARRVKYYVTNKRVIRYMSSATREEMDDLLCTHITSISLVSVARKRLIWTGAILLVIGLIALAVQFILGDNSFITSLTPYYKYACYGFGGLGLLLIILGFILRRAYYQFIAAGINSPEIAPRWRIEGVGAAEARDFIRLVREADNV